jgi:hypothetical protein
LSSHRRLLRWIYSPTLSSRLLPPPDCGCTGCRRRVIDRPLVVLDLHATGVGESYKANPRNFATLEVCLKGATSVSSRWSARLATKSVTEEPSSVRFLVVASPARWSRGSTGLAQGHVPCIPYTVALPPIFATLLLLLPVDPTCLVDPSGLPGTRMWRLLPVVLDAASSWLRSRGAASWVCAKLLVCGCSCFIFLFFIFSFVLELCATVCN